MRHLCGYDRNIFDVRDTLFAELPGKKNVFAHSEIENDEDEDLGSVEPVLRSSAISFVGHGILPVRTNLGIKLPDFVKRTLGASQSRIFLGLHETDPCLVLFAEDTPGAFVGRKSARRVFGFCEELWRPFADVRLPNWARTLAGISACALFVGTGTTFELWSLEEAVASGDANLVALARSAAQFRK